MSTWIWAAITAVIIIIVLIASFIIRRRGENKKSVPAKRGSIPSRVVFYNRGKRDAGYLEI
jgi:heme/copper-type cytochrome/quinol oxidase subunit 2